MKNILAFALGLALVALAPSAQAETSPFGQGGRFGLGLGSSSITSGISGKYFLSESMSLQGVVGGFYNGGYGGIGVGADLLFEMPSLVSNSSVGLNWYVGPGASVGLGSWFSAGVSGVAGLSLGFKAAPIELAAEIRPTFLIGEYWNNFYFGGGGHIRYFF